MMPNIYDSQHHHTYTYPDPLTCADAFSMPDDRLSLQGKVSSAANSNPNGSSPVMKKPSTALVT